MRVDPELVYNDYKDRVIGAFNLFGKKVGKKQKILLIIWQMKMTIC